MPGSWAEYAALLREGGVIACPTETLFGLLADALNEASVARVVAIKRRGPEPIALIVPDLASAERVVASLSPLARALAERYWPGPLTLIARARPGLANALVREGTIGVRVPGPSAALSLVREFAGPLTATSCNPSGRPAARTAQEARAYFPEGLAAIVPGSAPGTLASTVVDVTGEVPRIVRRGAIALDV
jgi:L-threonylcarbamoyladenylate synthase